MGYCHDDYPGHEGFTVGYVLRDGTQPDSGLFRELSYPGDDGDRADVALLAAGCECGWRSPRFLPEAGRAEWGPFMVLESVADEEKVRALWADHLAQLPSRRRR